MEMDTKTGSSAVKSKVHVAVFKFGAREPAPVAEVREQLFLAHRYQNKLIEIERLRRQCARVARREMFPDFEDLEKQYAAADDAVGVVASRINAAVAAAQSKKAITPEMKAALRDAKEVKKPIGEKLKQMRLETKTNQGLLDAWKVIKDESNDKHKAARAECSVYWGTYQRVEESMEQSKKATKGDIRFRRFDGCGAVAVHFQNEIVTWRDLIDGNNNKLQISPMGTVRRGGQVYQARWWLCSETPRKPTYATVEFTLHRPIDADAKISWFCLHRDRIGRHDKWHVTFTVSGVFAPKSGASTGTVSVDLGWRVVKDGLRVAYWVGDDGAEGELVLPESLVRRFDMPHRLQSIRDQMFNGAVEKLRSWAKDRTLPEWFAEKIKYAAQWKSPKHFARLLQQWRESRFEGDAEIYAALEGGKTVIDGKPHYTAYMKQECHLFDWQSHQRDRCQRQREELYRQFACMLRRRYAVCVLPDTDLRLLAEQPAIESSEPIISAPRFNRTVAATSILKSALALCGPVVIKRKASWTTLTCHRCNHVNSFDASMSIVQSCEKCGDVFDQDANAAKNRLANGGEAA